MGLHSCLNKSPWCGVVWCGVIPSRTTQQHSTGPNNNENARVSLILMLIDSDARADARRLPCRALHSCASRLSLSATLECPFFFSRSQVTETLARPTALKALIRCCVCFMAQREAAVFRSGLTRFIPFVRLFLYFLTPCPLLVGVAGAAVGHYSHGQLDRICCRL